MTRVAPWRVVIAGGGVAGIEALLGLRTLGEGCLKLALVTPDLHFVLRPHAVAEPFGGPPSPSLPYAEIAREQGARFVRDRVRGGASGRAGRWSSTGAASCRTTLSCSPSERRPRAFHPAVLTFDGPAQFRRSANSSRT